MKERLDKHIASLQAQLREAVNAEEQARTLKIKCVGAIEAFTMLKAELDKEAKAAEAVPEAAPEATAEPEAQD